MRRGQRVHLFSSRCCSQCLECAAELKKTVQWAACTCWSSLDTQAAHCTVRCENNMYETNGTCRYCTTCKEGQLP